MPTYRIPVLIWEDHSGYFTANLVEDQEAPAGVGATAAEALSQVKEYLEWVYQNQSSHSLPDFLAAKLVTIRVEVRPEYQYDSRVYPCDEVMTLRLPCVYGQNDNGSLCCSLPTLGVRFFYQAQDKLKDLVKHYAQERFRGLTPRALSRFLPAKQTSLEEIVLHINRKERRSGYTPSLEVLETIAEPLGDKKLRRQFSRAWERDYQVTDLVRRLSHEKANVLLVGDSGIGKTTLLIEAVRQIESAAAKNEDDEDENDRPRFKFWQTSGARLIAGMQYLGEWQARCEHVIEELSGINGVLCLENLLDLIRSGTGNASESLAAFLLPFMQRGELRVVAEATPAELDACRRLLPGFVDVFQLLQLYPLTEAAALTVLNRIAGNHARNHKLEIPDGVTTLIYRLFKRFQPYQAFPGTTVAFLHELVERNLRAGNKTIAQTDVIAQFVRQTGLPELFLRDELPLARAEVLATFRQQVIGQETACQAATDLVVTFKASLNDPQRPLGVLLFCGPTGVGKTELARALARYFFGHGEHKDAQSERLVRLDLSEYAGWGAAQRLLLGPDGEPSEFLKKVRQQPFCVVLLDEVEKADAAVFDVLLSLFDEGRLTDRYGRVTTFRSAVIVMTSNLGADKLETVGFETKGAPSYSREAMNFFRPEFFNRIDAVVQFNSLSKDMMRAIVNKELGEIAGREGLSRQNLRLAWTAELVEHLIAVGFDQRYGARPLQRTIESLLVAPLAKHLLTNKDLKNGTLQITLNDDNIPQFDWLGNATVL